MVLPTKGLGSRYVHCSLADNDERTAGSAETLTPHNPPSTLYRTGFSCIAAEDNTVIKMKLRTTYDYCITYKLNKAQETAYNSPTLNKGQT